MRYIEIPETIILRTLAADQPEDVGELTFQAFVKRLVIPDPAFGKGYEADASRVQLMGILEVAAGLLAVDDGLWTRMVTAVVSPVMEVNNAIRFQLFPYQQAIVDANEQKPVVSEV